MSVLDVAVQDVWKQYRLTRKRNAPTFWALQGVHLEVPRGSALGVIGRNGAGKSTLFKLLSGITAPTRGRITIQGRLAALIEVGSGFHPDLTGRENVFLSGSILGMRRREIAAKLERIVEFSGVGRFIDTPVKWYSSGMYVRLGFAIAAHMEPDILLVDEVLAVGDAEFQLKCLRRIQDLARQGTTSLFITHDLTAVERLCDAAVLLEGGRVIASGRPADVVADYHRRLSLWGPAPGDAQPEDSGSGVALTNLTVHAPREPQAVSFETGAPLTIAVRYVTDRAVPSAEFELQYYSSDGKTRIASPRTGECGERIRLEPPGGVVEFTCECLPLTPGCYYLAAAVHDLATSQALAWWDGETRLYVDRGPATSGQFYFPHAWRVTHTAASAAASAAVSGAP